jgi:predicted lipid-binding transport protein (Tim44 family)
MVRNHEINRMEDVRIDRIDPVNVRYTNKDYQREFTALITATIKDYYVDDRTGNFLRGDDSAAQFQEFWTFQLQNGQWFLREIEQTRESDALKDENFMEAFTDVQLEQIYGEAVDKTGPAGPWLEQAAATKALKIERMLNFLYETDKLWNRQQMLERARQIFTDIYMAYEAGQLSSSLAGQLFPAVAQKITEEINNTKLKGWTTEYRNFCVRKVELLLVRNFNDNTRDEYFTRISAHAQTAINQNGKLLRQDEDVSPFEEYWTFGRLDNQWKLKEILPPAGGQSILQQENLDEESSPDQVQWYYTKKRTV